MNASESDIEFYFSVAYGTFFANTNKVSGAMFFVTLASFWDHVGSIFEVSGTLGQHSGVSE